MKVRHLPVVVDAVIWDGTNDAIDELRALGLGVGDYAIAFTSDDQPLAMVLHTADGDRTANPGDAIVKGVLGEWYPVQADVYARVYRPLDDREGEVMADVYARHYGGQS